MLTTTAAATIDPSGVVFTLTVPGDQRWTLRSVIATANRDTTVADRTFVLSYTNQTVTVAQSAAQDTGPGLTPITITWANSQPAILETTTQGWTVAPLIAVPLPAGYQIIGSITDPQPLDVWTAAIAWYDFVYNRPA